MKAIPISSINLRGNEKKYVSDCIDTSWLSSLGQYVEEFEGVFSNFLGVNHSATCSSGTAALHLSLRGLDINEGDEVIVPSFTFIASINAILYCNATPVFVDIDPETWCLDPEEVRKNISSKTKAIMVVHLYGNPADMDAFSEIAKSNNIAIIEDCAEALGAKYKGKYVGSFGDVSCYSFYGNKIITTGEGGMVSTNNTSLFNRIRNLRDHAMDPEERYQHLEMGYNYRMTNMQAAVGLAQFERIDEFFAERARIFSKYYERLEGNDFITLPFPGNKEKYPVNWLFTILIQKKMRDELQEYLGEKGIDTRPVFRPGHKMPYINSHDHLPVTDAVSRQGVSLPTFMGLTDYQIDYICSEVDQFFGHK